VRTSFAACHLAIRHLSEGGLLVLTGSGSCLGPTPSLLAYGTAKASVHHIVRSLAASPATSSPLPKHALVAAILPICIDTPANRAAMPKADTSNWTPTEVIAQRLVTWAQREGKEPINGGLYVIETKAGQTKFTLSQ